MSDRKTTLSPDRKYRYTLWREWNMENDLIETMSGYDRTHEYLNVIGLNPSTADETKDDPTIRRCIDFAQRFGFGALCMTNLFAWRATYPRELLTVSDPVGGVENDLQLVKVAQDAGMVICGWGKSVPIIGKRAELVTALVQQVAELRCLRMNKDGSPEHPLFIPADTIDILYRPRSNRDFNLA